MNLLILYIISCVQIKGGTRPELYNKQTKNLIFMHFSENMNNLNKTGGIFNSILPQDTVPDSIKVVPLKRP